VVGCLECLHHRHPLANLQAPHTHATLSLSLPVLKEEYQSTVAVPHLHSQRIAEAWVGLHQELQEWAEELHPSAQMAI
jgi:hypothetical protein